jgi:hypothetical protein
MRLAWIAAAAALSLAAPAVHGQDLAGEKCSTCHPASRVEFQESVHAREEVGCTSCHGGDAASLDADRAHRGSFRALTNRQAIPASCAECHSDLARMRPYNLPVDQYAVYQTSRHGLAIAAGDLNCAVCSDCHGAHDTQRPDDPRSRVHLRNLPGTCGTCHSDEAQMRRYELDTGVVQAYTDSVHGQALLLDGVQNAPSCNSCHGVHGATPPGVGDIDKVCGHCHTETRKAFLAGPHYPAMAEADLPECSSCHSHHAIERQDLESLEGLCADCHGTDSDEAALGSKLHTLIVAASEEVDAAEELLEEASRVPLHVEDHLSRVEEARTYLTETAPLVHAVTMEPVEQVTRRARSIGEEIRHEVYPKLSRKTAHIGLALYWFYILMTLAILVRHRTRIKNSSEQP